MFFLLHSRIRFFVGTVGYFLCLYGIDGNLVMVEVELQFFGGRGLLFCTPMETMVVHTILGRIEGLGSVGHEESWSWIIVLQVVVEWSTSSSNPRFLVLSFHSQFACIRSMMYFCCHKDKEQYLVNIYTNIHKTCPYHQLSLVILLVYLASSVAATFNVTISTVMSGISLLQWTIQTTMPTYHSSVWNDLNLTKSFKTT